MKKYILAFSLMLSVLSCVSCQEKKTEDISENPEIQEDIQQDNSFREYTDSDFKDINIIINRSQGQPPVNTYEKEVYFNFGRRVSPCKGEEFYEKFIPYYYINQDYEQDSEYIRKMCETGSTGRAEWFCINGNMMYFTVSHDDFCHYFSHDISIYSYNFDTEITEEIYNYSGTDYGMNINRLHYSDGLFFITEKAYTDDMKLTSHGWDYGDSGEKRECELCRLDEKNKKIITISKEPYDDYYFSESENGFIIKDAEFSGANNSDASYILSEYNTQTNKIDTIFSGAVNEIPVPCGNGFVTYTKDDSKNITVNADNYTLSTQIHGDVSCASENRIIISHSDYYQSYSKDKIYIYDFNTMERYILDLTGYGSRVYPCGENLIIYGDAAQYYLIPEKGQAFFLGTNINMPVLDNESGKTYITSISSNEGYSNYVDDDGNMQIEEIKGDTSGRILFIEQP